MENFVYDITTKILFGKGQIENLGKEIKRYTDSVLLVYGDEQRALRAALWLAWLSAQATP